MCDVEQGGFIMQVNLTKALVEVSGETEDEKLHLCALKKGR